MTELLHFFGSTLTPWTIDEALSRTQQLLLSFDILVWLFAITLLRYDLPAFAVWVIGIVKPRAFAPPAFGGPWPLVSVIIAGRNPGEGIRQTIRSVLDSGYPDVEVLYIDDCSTDDSVYHARSFERNGRVRVFSSSQHNGKPTTLNIGINMARGDLSFVLDADAEIEVGTIHRLAAYFSDLKVGAVSANIFLRNARHNLLTRLQEIEYALNGSIARLWRSGLGLLPILPGAASMFRTSALRELGGYDTGLGDDTDMTLRMRKRGWVLKFSLEARMWTDQPENLAHLFAQRTRWARNMVKIRLRKHADFINPIRYGFASTIMALDNLLFRVILPIYVVCALALRLLRGSDEPIVLTALYGLVLFFVCCRILIASDLSRTPPLIDLALAPLYPFYRIMLRTVEVFVIVRELLRIRLYHPYVPKRIWSEVPHW